MRYSLIFILAAFPSFLSAETVTTTSTLDAVKVFPQGALYNRNVALDLPAGVHQIFVSDLPSTLVVETIQAKATGLGVRALEFRTERQVLLAPEKTGQLVAAEQVLDGARAVVSGLVNQRAVTRASIASAKLRIQYLQSTADGKLAGNGTQETQTAEQLAAVVQALGAQVSTAIVELTKAENALAGTDRVLAEAREDVFLAETALNAVEPLDRATGTVVIDLVTDAAFKGELTLLYFDNNARWRPTYEVSVEQSDATAAVDIVRLAAVTQDSGEDWSDVAVTLSTSDIGRTSQVYLPRSDIKYIYQPEKLQRLAKQSYDLSASKSLAEPVVEAPVPAPSSGYTVTLRGQTLEFDLGRVASLQGDGANKLFRLDTMHENVDLTAQATIWRNDIAVLYAELKNTTGGTLLPGEATLIRDGVLVGSARIPEVANGDTFDLALGPLNGILLEPKVLEVQDGDTGIISSYSQKIEKYEVTVRSLLDYPIDVSVFTALPVSESEDLEITLKTKPKPTEMDIEGRRGVVSWALPMAAQSVEKITYGWTLKWPENQGLGQR